MKSRLMHLAVILVILFHRLYINSMSAQEPSSSPEASVNYDILLSGLDRDCQLPCWHNLVLDTSTTEDFIAAINMLELDWTPERNRNTESDRTPYTEWFANYQEGTPYEGDDIDFNTIGIRGFFVDNQLQGILFGWSGTPVNMLLPRYIFENIGVPDEIELKINNRRGFLFWIIYHDPEIHVQYWTPSIDLEPLELCITPDGFEFPTEQVSLNISLLNPEAPQHELLEMLTINRLEMTNTTLYNLEEVTEFDANSFVEFVLSNDSMCLEIDEKAVSTE